MRRRATGVKRIPARWPSGPRPTWIDSGVADQSIVGARIRVLPVQRRGDQQRQVQRRIRFTSAENKEDLPFGYLDPDGTAVANRKGYHIDTPFDKHADVREEMVVSSKRPVARCVITTTRSDCRASRKLRPSCCRFRLITDKMMYMKDIIHNMALTHGLTATFMPKPLYDEPGSGMHFHIQLEKDGKNVFYRKGGYADLSERRCVLSAAF